MTRSRLVLSSVLVMLLAGWLLLPGHAEAQKRGGTLIMLVQPEPPTLAAYQSTSGPIGQVMSKVYEGLLEYDFNLKPIPGLAQSWTVSPDGKTITFKLQHGVTFHDGKPFTSADVKFSIHDVLRKLHPRGPGTFREVTEIDTPDEHTVIFRLANPAPYLMMALSGYESPMLPKHLFEGTDPKTSKYANQPVGTGPFKFVEWRRGEFIRLDRNPDYWRKGRPYLDRIVARFIADSATRTASIEKGDVHLAGFAAIPWSDVPALAKVPHIVTTTKGYEMSSPIVELDFNTTKPPFDNLKVRQAVSYAINRKFIIDNVWFKAGKPATGPISSNFTVAGFYTPDVRRYEVPNGIEIANKLLDEAGFKRGANGIRFEIVHDLTPYGEEWQRFGEAVQQTLAQIGIKATLRYEDVPTWLRRLYTDYDFQLSSNWIQGLADPVIGVHRLYHSKAIRQGVVFVNESRWSSPRTDELMDQATVEPDARKRGALYKEFQKLVVEAAPILWVHELQFVTVHHKDFKDLIVSPLGIYAAFDRAYLDK
ncbi:MAG TPA: ABC transporter substrate-binding protein [Methylomirabilota bacterium]|jgi:peptide/nickel transport system substrate-binding protein